MSTIAHNVERVRERVARALERAGDERRSVTIVAVTKTFGADVVRDVIRAGITDIGENRVQELAAKAREIDLPCRWHLVGTLQRNKAAKAVGLVHLIHSIDGVRIAQTVDRVAAERGLRVRVLLEVNASGEAAKHGVDWAEVEAVAAQVFALPHLDPCGLMTIGPASVDPAATRACFRRLADLARALRAQTGIPLAELSMGMSDDFEIALEEGATILRLGRVLVGARMPIP
jgi:pyridoxal phosphate enzyme (YggS family)